ncbi:MAG TPA: helix-turn-helix transcriptional regulator [Hanamia sp.]|nr:helix-turn-helix transcriptional regulator [Hanamia sp.]
MNKILFTARKAKGLSEKQIIEKLKIDETTYKEIELGISTITFEMSKTLEKIFNVPFHYFLTPCADNIQTAIYALEKAKEILTEAPDIRDVSVPAHTHLSIAKMGLNALIAEEKQTLLLIQVKDLMVENEFFKELYETAKSNTNT